MNSVSNSQSELWRHRANAVLAGKQSNFRPGPALPAIIANKAEGVRIIDVDGKDYIDFVLGMGPAIWGHSNPELNTAVVKQMDRQFSAASSLMHTTLEIELAEKIVEHVPCAELVRFGLTGTEADQMAMRLGRGVTGRRYVLRFEGHYNGWVDNVFGGELMTQDPEHPFPTHSASAGAGLAAHSQDDIMMVRWNDAEALEAVLKAHGDKIAMLMMEAIMCNNGSCPPRPGYLERVRELCDQYGVLLCFDEVITGFRVAIGGAQEMYGVTPDLAVFGKAMAGGLPLAAVAGRREILSHLSENKVLGGGTFNSFPLAMATGLATMEMLERDSFAFYERLSAVQGRIVNGLLNSAKAHGYDFLVQGPPGFLFFAFTPLDVAYTPHELASANMVRAMKFRGHLEEAGVVVAGGSRLVTSPAMSEKDIEDALIRFDTAFRNMRAAGD